MQLRWKTFESKWVDEELPQDPLGKFLGFKPSIRSYTRFHPPILQFSHDGETWHDVPFEHPIPFEEWHKDE